MTKLRGCAVRMYYKLSEDEVSGYRERDKQTRIS